MTDLVTWLRAQFDDDERVAIQATTANRRRWVMVVQSIETESGGVIAPTIWPQDGPHIIRWDPVRVLAEVDAKRRILDLHGPVIDGSQSSWTWFAGSESESTAIVKLLALPYADEPGYREEWKP